MNPQAVAGRVERQLDQRMAPGRALPRVDRQPDAWTGIDFSWQLGFVNWVRSRVGLESLVDWDVEAQGAVAESAVPFLDDARIAALLAAHPQHQVMVEVGAWDGFGGKLTCEQAGLAARHRLGATVSVRCLAPNPRDEVRKLFLFDQGHRVIAIRSDLSGRRIFEAFVPGEVALREIPVEGGVAAPVR